MKTILRLGPGDAGRPLTLEEFTSAACEEGHRYELINGRLSVVPAPDAPEGMSEYWLLRRLLLYSAQHPEVINFVYNKVRVFVPDPSEPTVPEPDIAAYSNFPLDQDRNQIAWEDVSPILVVEILSPAHPEKDLVRNVELYLRVPTIREYWIVDGREDADRPRLLVHRRRGQRWQKVIEVGPGQTYSTRLLPGFSLTVDPHA